MRDIAIKYLDAGLSVIPIKANTKAPSVKWTEYMSEAMTKDSASEKFVGDVGVAVVCGYVSGGLECLDFDNHFKDAKTVFADYCKIVEVEEVMKKYNLPIETSPSGGFHVFFRSRTPQGSQKLARRSNKQGRPETLIETRGEGGYVIIAPTTKYVLTNGNFADIPEITPDERDVLLSGAKSMNEWVDQSNYATKTNGADDRPGDEYDRSVTAVEDAKNILLSNGWTTANGVHWIRPGKKRGISATFGKVAANVFYVFSTNAHPFEDRKAYTPWQIYAILEFNFDFTNAAKALVERGFGKKNDNLKVIWKKVRQETRKGQTLQPGEINEIAESMNVSVKLVSDEVQRAQEKYKGEWNYEKLAPVEKVEIFLKNNYKFRMDTISRLPYMSRCGSEWTDINTDSIYREMQHERIKFSHENLKSLLRSDFVERYNPFEDYFHSLPAWDGVDYIRKVAEHVKVDDQEFFNKMFEKALVRNIACALEPLNVNRIVFTLISEAQWIGKSYFIQWINPFGAKYYTDEQLHDNKDSRFALCENFIYNLEELDSLSRYDISRLKATISSRGVKDRLPYAVNKESFARVCSFWGSTNRQEFLVDDHNTRWLCFQVDKIDWEYSKTDVKNIWIQAWSLYKSKDYDAELSREESTLRDEKNDDHRVVDFESSIILKYFVKSTDRWMSNAEIMEQLVVLSDNKIKLNTTPQKLGRIMAQLGFSRTKRGNERGWEVALRNYNKKEDVDDLPF